MKITDTNLRGVIIVEPDVFGDSRGFFLESYNEAKYSENGLLAQFVVDSLLSSTYGVITNLRTQVGIYAQTRLIRVVQGEIYCAVADIRRGSPSFGQTISVTLSEENFRQLYIPPGFVFGYCVTSENAMVATKYSEYPEASNEFFVAWDDPDLAIPWPIADPIPPGFDAAAPTLSQLGENAPKYVPPDAPLSLYFDMEDFTTDDVSSILHLLELAYGSELEIVQMRPLPPGEKSSSRALKLRNKAA